MGETRNLGTTTIAMEHHYTPKPGWLEVITGSMFSGKSEELIRRLRRAQIAKQHVQIFKPALDNRFSEDEIVSHSEMKIPSTNVSTARELFEKVLRGSGADCRVHHQDAGDLHGLRRARESHAAAGRLERARARRRVGDVRGAVPALLRSDARRLAIDDRRIRRPSE